MYVYYKIELYRRLDSGSGNWSTIPYEVTGAFTKTINLGIKDKKDSFSFNLLNTNNKYFGSGAVFRNGDRIVIYAKKNSTTVTIDDMLIDGTILVVKEQMAGSNIITIEGKNRTEMFLEGISFISTSVDKTPAEILEAALVFHNSNNENFHITWKSDNPPTSPTAGKKSDGTDFPAYKVDDFYKPMNILFERYSSNEYTQDGNYYYYINPSNELVWKQMNSTVETTTPIEEEECESITCSNKTDNIVNALIIYCGSDAYNRGVRTQTSNWSSMAKNGAKFKIMTSTNSTASEIMTAEATKSGKFTDGKTFPDSGEYPYTTTWGVVCANDKEYNEALRTQIKNQAKLKGEEYLKKLSAEPLTVNATLPFTKKYVLGGVYYINFPSYGVSNKLMRIHNIAYHDYTVTLELKEDELKI